MKNLSRKILKRLRVSKGYSLAGIANAIGISVRTLTTLENEPNHKTIGPKLLEDWFNALELDELERRYIKHLHTKEYHFSNLTTEIPLRLRLSLSALAALSIELNHEIVEDISFRIQRAMLDYLPERPRTVDLVINQLLMEEKDE